MSLTWKNVDTEAPQENQVILVIDSWNIDELDVDEATADKGRDAQDLLSLRVATYDKKRGTWVANTNEQRVRFKYYVPIQIPGALVLEGFKFGQGGESDSIVRA